MRITTQELREAGPALSVSIVAADPLQIGEALTAIQHGGAHVVHVDVMDGVFCPEITVGPKLVRAIPDTFVKDCHLMVDQPLEKVGAFVEAGADIVTFQVEATRHPHRILQSLAGSGVLRGVAVNPGTPLEVVVPLLGDLDVLVVLAVNPGWGGQRFIPTTEERVAQARRLIEGREIALEIDGGVTAENLREVAALGGDLVVSGSAVFARDAPEDNVRSMLAAIEG